MVLLMILFWKASQLPGETALLQVHAGARLCRPRAGAPASGSEQLSHGSRPGVFATQLRGQVADVRVPSWRQ